MERGRACLVVCVAFKRNRSVTHLDGFIMVSARVTQEEQRKEEGNHLADKHRGAISGGVTGRSGAFGYRASHWGCSQRVQQMLQKKQRVKGISGLPRK